MRSRSQLIQPTRSLAGSGWSRSMISSATRGAPAEAMPLTVARFASGGGAEAAAGAATVAAGAAGLVTAAGSVMVEGAGTGLAAEAGAAGVPAAVATAVEAAGVAARFLEALG